MKRFNPFAVLGRMMDRRADDRIATDNVAKLFDDGLDTHQIAFVLEMDEAKVCNLLAAHRDRAYEQSRGIV